MTKPWLNTSHGACRAGKVGGWQIKLQIRQSVKDHQTSSLHRPTSPGTHTVEEECFLSDGTLSGKEICFRNSRVY